VRQTEVREPGTIARAVRNDHVARENPIHGACQSKLALRVALSSNFNPVDVIEYTEAEIKAVVTDAESWDTYVTVHS
jgi:imidazolonepropionase-like amidohydrolase